MDSQEHRTEPCLVVAVVEPRTERGRRHMDWKGQEPRTVVGAKVLRKRFVAVERRRDWLVGRMVERHRD